MLSDLGGRGCMYACMYTYNYIHTYVCIYIYIYIYVGFRVGGSSWMLGGFVSSFQGLEFQVHV